MQARRHLAMVYSGLIAGYLILAAAELTESLHQFKAALFVDGLHNAGEILPLGLCIIEHRRQSRGAAASNIPRYSAILTLVAALAVAPYALTHQHGFATTKAIELVISSLSLNIFGMVLVELLSGHDDHNAEGVVAHLIGDTAVSGSALVAYIAIAHGASTIFDPQAIIVGTTVAAFINLRFVHLHGSGHSHMNSQS